MEQNQRVKSWRIVGFITLMIVLQQLDKNAISIAAVPISKELGFNATQMGLVISAFFGSYAAMNVIGGYLTDRFGSRKVIITTVILWSIFTGMTGLMMSLSAMIAIRFLFGAAEGAFPSTNFRVCAELFPAERRALPKSFMSAAASLGLAAAAIVVTNITNVFSWRAAFGIYCILGLMMAGIYFFLTKDIGKAAGMDTVAGAKVPIKELLKTPLIWKIIPSQFAVGVFIWGLNSWMPTYWMNVKGLKLVAMGWAASLPSIASFIVMLGMGFMYDKYLMGKEKRVMLTSIVIAGIFVYFTFISSTVTMGVICMAISTISIGLLMQANMVVVVKYFPKECVGTAGGIANTANQIAGFLVPALMGYILTVSGGNYTYIFAMVIVVLIVAFAIASTIDTKQHAAEIKAQVLNRISR